MKNKILELIFVGLFNIISIQTLTAQVAIKLIGFTSNGQTVDNLVKWNAGETSFLETNQVDYIGVLAGSSVYNSNNGEYYSRVLVNENEDYISKILTYNSQSSLIELNEVTSVYNGSAEVDMQSGLLYSYDADLDYNIFLNRYDPVTQTSTNLGLFNENDLGILFPDGSCFDSDNKIYYFITQTEDGKKLVKSTIINDSYSYTLTPLIGQNIIGNIGLEYSNEQNKIHLIYPEFNIETGTSTLNVGVLNSETGEITNLVTITEVTGLQLFNRTYDQATETLAFIAIDLENEQRLYLYNTVTNELSNQPLPQSIVTEIEADNYAFAQMRYGSLGLNQEDIEAFSVFPNPANEVLNINFKGLNCSYELLDIMGKSIQEGTILNGEQIDINKVSKGMYILNLRKENFSENIKIIIQ